MRRIRRVHLETSEQCPLTEWKWMIAEKCIIITEQMILHAEAQQPDLMLDNCLHKHTVHLHSTMDRKTTNLYPNDIDCATVRDNVRFIRKSQRFQ